jgi:phage gp46-like protein
LETRRLHALAREKTLDRITMDAQDAPDAHRVEAAVVDQAPNCFRVDAELVGNVADADEAVRLLIRR